MNFRNSIANIDYLTGLYTRQSLYIIYDSMEKGSHFHLMFMDIDNFKNVNDVYGHNEGDVLLKAFARILQENAPMSKAIRLGGDEFVLIFDWDCSKEYLCSIADAIISGVRDKKGFEHIAINVSLSVGILHDEIVSGNLDEILIKGDRAMYYSKNNGKNRWAVFDDISEQVLSEIKMEKLQQKALEKGELEIRYLPVINALSSTLRMTQVRLFWNMPDGAVKTQKEFLPLFERNGFIHQVNMWMLDTVIGYIRKYHEISDSPVKVGIPFSRLLLLRSDFARILKERTEAAGIEPAEIEINVDESAFVRGSDEMFSTIEKLTDAGFSVAVTGVGSEFKSLAFWDKYTFAAITFDPVYLSNTISTPRGRQILKTLLAMGKQLKMRVMADGITCKDDVLFLSGCGCNNISGPYYSEALSLDDYYKYIEDKLPVKIESISFRFRDGLTSTDGRFTGEIRGDGVSLTDGITDNWGGVHFPGGTYENNVIELPCTILTEPSYTVCMWLKPLNSSSWTSAYYARYQRSFAAFSPYVIGGTCIFRVSEDGDLNGFHDVWARHLPPDVWTFVCVTFDDVSEIGRIYINGRKAGFMTGVPALTACRQILLGGDPFQPSYEGYMSGLTFYNGVKTEDEIQDIYQKFCEEPGFCGSVEDFWL